MIQIREVKTNLNKKIIEIVDEINLICGKGVYTREKKIVLK